MVDDLRRLLKIRGADSILAPSITETPGRSRSISDFVECNQGKEECMYVECNECREMDSSMNGKKKKGKGKMEMIGRGRAEATF